MSNVAKSVGKIFKRVAKALKPLVKPVLIGAAIYFGGSALGMWGSGATAGTTAGTVAGPPIGVGSSMAETAGGIVDSAMATGGATKGMIGAGMAGKGPLLSAAGGTEVAAAQGANALWGSMSPAAPKVSFVTGLKNAAGSMLKYIEEKPGTALIAGNMLQSAFTPSESEEAIKLDKYKRRTSSFYGVSGSGKGKGSDITKLYNTVRKPRGIVGGAMGNY